MQNSKKKIPKKISNKMQNSERQRKSRKSEKPMGKKRWLELVLICRENQEVIEMIRKNYEDILTVQQEKELDEIQYNNPEKVKEYLEKFMENYGIKN